jgi:hypothetical protein
MRHRRRCLFKERDNIFVCLYRRPGPSLIADSNFLDCGARPDLPHPLKNGNHDLQVSLGGQPCGLNKWCIAHAGRSDSEITAGCRGHECAHQTSIVMAIFWGNCRAEIAKELGK